MSLWWLFAFYALERGAELLLARRNRRRLLARGGREIAPESFRPMLALHLLFFLALAIESRPWFVPLDALTLACLAVLALAQGLRYWCIATLGEFWNTRIVVVPGMILKTGGPYRFLRHPNYLAVTLEFAALPLLMRAPVTLVLFSLANLAVLRRRIALEERGLQEAARGGG